MVPAWRRERGEGFEAAQAGNGLRVSSRTGVSTQAATMGAAEKEQGTRSKIADGLWRWVSSSPV